MLHNHLVTSTFVAQKSIVGLYLKNVCLKDATFWEKALFSINIIFLWCLFLSAGMRSGVCDKPGLAVSPLLEPKTIDGELDQTVSCVSYFVGHLNSFLP